MAFYPVIFLSFKDVKCDTWEKTYEVIAKLIRAEYQRHSELLSSSRITGVDQYQKIYNDQANESDYMMSLMYIITSNRESGEGRYDISLCPRDSKMPGILIELKAASNASAKALRELADTALLQIKEKRYDTEMRTRGIQTVFKYGVAFSGKNVEISAE